MRIFLTGFMGAGKTTIGRLLAQKLRYPFYDLDVEIQMRFGQTTERIFLHSGEGEFRKMERECIQTLMQDPVVIATGGGCFIHNREWMLDNGTVIYLKVPFERLAERVGADPQRPLWRNARELFDQRSADYEQAHLTVNADVNPENVLEEILQRVGLQPDQL